MSGLYRLLVREQLTRGRVAAIGAVGALGVLIGIFVGTNAGPDRAQVAFGLISNFMLAIFAPVTSLVFASASLGEPHEDGTLVYMWLRPVSRWSIALSSLAATLSVTLPLVVVPTAAAAASTREGVRFVAAATLATGIAVVAYSSVFVLVGLLLRRALAWGLLYVLVWEGLIAGLATGPARVSVRQYAASMLVRLLHRPPERFSVSLPLAVIVPLAVAGAAVAFTTLRLRRISVA